jgi:hypothetical protein
MLQPVLNIVFCKLAMNRRLLIRGVGKGLYVEVGGLLLLRIDGSYIEGIHLIKELATRGNYKRR